MKELEKKVRENRPADKVKWHNEYKPGIRELVGFNRQADLKELKTSEAYATAYYYILDIIAVDL